MAAYSPSKNWINTPTYISWAQMLNRCRNPKASNYDRYGGAGVTVCERWQQQFENFLIDMGVRPPGTTLDRYPNMAGNYEPGNCRWATPKEQTANRRPWGWWAKRPKKVKKNKIKILD